MNERNRCVADGLVDTLVGDTAYAVGDCPSVAISVIALDGASLHLTTYVDIQVVLCRHKGYTLHLSQVVDFMSIPVAFRPSIGMLPLGEKTEAVS
jgi:hypothetical protein